VENSKVNGPEREVDCDTQLLGIARDTIVTNGPISQCAGYLGSSNIFEKIQKRKDTRAKHKQ
jgi:hypothetical protein